MFCALAQPTCYTSHTSYLNYLSGMCNEIYTLYPQYMEAPYCHITAMKLYVHAVSYMPIL